MTQQYREVKRKANVGERIRIVKAQYNEDYDNGDEFVVTNSYDTGGVDFIDNVGDENTASLSEYVVLEPVEATPIDHITADIAQMAVRLAAVEKELAELKRQPAYETPFGDESFPEYTDYIKTPKPRSRDDIIAQAKRDVVELTMQYTGMDSRVKFIVNRDKRTVVALRYYFGEVDYRGKAVCDPDDCFNVHIGKAIALRRTLGLEVPEEYVKCPAPTEVRVGDIVETFLSEGEPHETFKVAGIRKGKREILLYDTLEKYSDDGTYTPFEPEIGDRVIDDSREEA